MLGRRQTDPVRPDRPGVTRRSSPALTAGLLALLLVGLDSLATWHRLPDLSGHGLRALGPAALRWVLGVSALAIAAEWLLFPLSMRGWARRAPIGPVGLALLLAGARVLARSHLAGLGLVQRKLWIATALVALVALVLFALAARSRRPRAPLYLAATLLVAAIGAGLTVRALPRRPHVVLVGMDGMNARRMSVYGAERPTTPFLASLRKEALVAESAFSNSCCTLGATIATLSGKHPLRNHVYYPPQRVLTRDSLSHLGSILGDRGWATRQLLPSHYTDAVRAGLRGGFDGPFPVTARPLPATGMSRRLEIWLAPELALARSAWTRLRGRPEAGGPEDPVPAGAPDDRRATVVLGQLADILARAREPVFLHVHLMETHGPEFPVEKQVFSAGQPLREPFQADFYDDALREVDAELGRWWDTLKGDGTLDDAIVVFYSDHGQQWSTLERVPLMFRFPGGAFAGARQENAQLLDVAPTLLDALGIPRPAWMYRGASLLPGRGVDPDRIIVGAGSLESQVEEDGVYRLVHPEPPRYGLTSVTAVACQRWYRVDLLNGAVQLGALPPTRAGCPPGRTPSPRLVLQTTMSMLSEYGFSSLVADLDFEAEEAPASESEPAPESDVMN